MTAAPEVRLAVLSLAAQVVAGEPMPGPDPDTRAAIGRIAPTPPPANRPARVIEVAEEFLDWIMTDQEAV